jgi:pentatricopeptide repeat protein
MVHASWVCGQPALAFSTLTLAKNHAVSISPVAFKLLCTMCFQSDNLVVSNTLLKYLKESKDHIADRGDYLNLIRTFNNGNQFSEGLSVLTVMDKNNIIPDSNIFVALLKSCAGLKRVDVGKDIHSRMLRTQLPWTPFLRTALLQVFAKCNDVRSATSLFGGMKREGFCLTNFTKRCNEPDLLVYTTGP